MGLLSYVVNIVIIAVHSLLITYLLGKDICAHISKQVPVYIAEITPKNLRGGFTTVHQVK